MSANPHLSRVTLLLVGVATLLIQAALHEREPGAGLPLLGVSLLGALGLSRWARTKRVKTWRPAAVAGVLALSLLPAIWDVVTRSALGRGAPYEVQLAYVLRNAMLALAAMPHLPRATSHAVLGSFFLTLFGCLWTRGPWAVALLVVYTLLGTWWLLAAYWDRLGGRFADSSERAIPLRPALAAFLVLALAAAVLLPLAGHSPTTTALAGFFPSSGGTDWSDPFAYGGVGDGDQMVAGKEQASSFGPVDSELFLESKMPSLYDAFNEFSEAKPKKQKQQRRAIPLGASQVQTNHRKTGVTQRATREFSTVRQTKARRRDLEDRLAASLLLVKGRTPLHLALETYDRWDGQSLLASETSEPLAMTLRPADRSGRRWLKLGIEHPTTAFTTTEASQVRIVNLKTERVPTPAGAEAVTLTALHNASMFSFAPDGSLAMGTRPIPQLTILEFRSALGDRYDQPTLARTATNESGRVADLAAKWTRGVPAGWPQVEAIVQRLRERCTLDPAAMVPEEAEDAVEHFLFESQRGADYLFATSTALLLRSLGYDTRVRSGFYANPARRSSKSQLTPVLAEDAHFWVEVRSEEGARVATDGSSLPGVWMTVEPTPGYEVLHAHVTLLAWLSHQAMACVSAVVAYPAIASLAALAAVLLIAARRPLLDGLLIGWWSVRAKTAESDGLARLTLRLLEWRAWLHRQRRPTGVTLGRWDALRSQDDFIALAGWALYGAGSSAPVSTQTARTVCGRAIRTRFGQLARRTPAASTTTRCEDQEEQRWKP